MSNVLAAPATRAEHAVAHFAAHLCFETHVSDVHAGLEAERPGGGGHRSASAWERGHLPGVVQLPTVEIRAPAAQLGPVGAVVVSYSWGPGCNGATRAALAWAALGHPVKGDVRRLRVLGPRGLPGTDRRRPVAPPGVPPHRSRDLP